MYPSPPATRITPRDYMPHLRVAAVSIAMLWAWAAMRHSLVNLDGVLYIHTSRAFLAHGWTEAFATYNWPFLSIAIGRWAQFWQVDPLQAAQTIAVFSSGALTLSFLQLHAYCINRMPSSEKVWIPVLHLLAAGCLLLHPRLVFWRDHILRDTWYWAFWLWGIRYTWQYQQTGFLHKQLAACAAIFLACLFRAEGIFLAAIWAIYWLAAPLLCTSRRGKLVRLVAYCTLWGGLLCLFLVAMLHHYPQTRVSHLVYALAKTGANSHAHWQQLNEAVYRHLLDPVARSLGVAPFFLIGGWLAYGVWALARAANVLLWATAALGYRYRHTPPCRLFHPLEYGSIWLIVAITLIQGGGQLFMHGILVDRWLMLPVFFPLLHAPSVLLHTYRDPALRYLQPYGWVLLCCAYSAHAVNLWGPSKAYIREAGLWIRTHQTTSPSPAAAIWVHDRLLGFYTGLPDMPNWQSDQVLDAPSQAVGAWCEYVRPDSAQPWGNCRLRSYAEALRAVSQGQKAILAWKIPQKNHAILEKIAHMNEGIAQPTVYRWKHVYNHRKDRVAIAYPSDGGT